METVTKKRSGGHPIRDATCQQVLYEGYTRILPVFRMFANASAKISVKVDQTQLLKCYVTNGECNPKTCLESGAKKVKLE